MTSRTYWRDVCRTGVAHKLVRTRVPGFRYGYERMCEPARADASKTVIACPTFWPKAKRRCKLCQARKITPSD